VQFVTGRSPNFTFSNILIFMHAKTFFIDIDGTIFRQPEDFLDVMKTDDIAILPEAAEKICKWHCQGNKIILTTARPESMRERTIKQLDNAGIMYDQLVMSLTSGCRVLINDYEQDTTPKAEARNVRRNIDGLINVNYIN
jgi:ribonucleotide monophosphatase NagD (HAD superfamily)